jgi:NADPH-dependent 2,4-dienoyl-CoA reductase/sulfur reductase-like enzyme
VQSLVLDGKIKNIVVVGGGFLGCQVAAKLAETGKIKQVTTKPKP